MSGNASHIRFGKAHWGIAVRGGCGSFDFVGNRALEDLSGKIQINHTFVKGSIDREKDLELIVERVAHIVQPSDDIVRQLFGAGTAVAGVAIGLR